MAFSDKAQVLFLDHRLVEFVFVLFNNPKTPAVEMTCFVIPSPMAEHLHHPLQQSNSSGLAIQIVDANDSAREQGPQFRLWQRKNCELLSFRPRRNLLSRLQFPLSLSTTKPQERIRFMISLPYLR